ncbi:thioredoxin-like protein [Radiomyces spectabilis]|uniref:thioredoxin-like protein n=1 Tax=Radiomyces spectabilis TaxID=64574 RepID=UPI00221F1DDD|nr:thioredoxin-like protein [Radiomyces spectabilis]KAI8388670.1 thioredoxin-like protein [Radiomyces spectabilis]
MEDALLAQLQNAHLHDDDDLRHESETGSEASDNDQDEDIYKDDDNDSIPFNAQHGGRQTGPKGVIADQKYHEQLQRDAQLRSQARHNARILAKAPTTTTYREDEAAKDELVLEAKAEESDGDLEDEAALQRFRQQRLAELRNMNNHAVRQQHRVFGTVQDITAEEYASVIDKEWKTVPIIIHLYDESIRECRTLDDYFVGLAYKYALAKFVRVSATDLEFDLVGSPAILAYRGGILVANLVRLIDEVGPQFIVDAVEDVLLRSGALSEDDLYDLPVRTRSDTEDDEEDG